MIAYLPIAGGHITLAERFVDPSFSFALGWNYWYGICVLSLLVADFHIPFRYHYVIVLPAELSAASVLIGYWNQTINGVVWITIGMVLVIVINLMGAGERFHLIQIRVSGLSLHSHRDRRLWRG